MAKIYNGGVDLGTGFKLKDPQPIADYMVVKSYSDLTNNTILPYQFTGMQTFVIDDNAMYIKKSGGWEALSSASTLQDVMNAGSTAYTMSNIIIQTNNGIATFQNNKGGISAGQTELNISAQVPIRLASDQGVIISSISVPAKYQNNLSANFDDRSIPDCEWVMGQITGASAPTLQQVINVGDTADRVRFTKPGFTSISASSNTNAFAAENGNIIVTADGSINNTGKRIMKFDANGNELPFNGVLEGNDFGGFILLSDGYLFFKSYDGSSDFNYNGVNSNLIKVNFNGDVVKYYNFSSAGSTTIYDVALDSENNLYIAGIFNLYEGVPVATPGSFTNCIIKILANGSIDTSFNGGLGYILPETPSPEFNTIAVYTIKILNEKLYALGNGIADFIPVYNLNGTNNTFIDITNLSNDGSGTVYYSYVSGDDLFFIINSSNDTFVSVDTSSDTAIGLGPQGFAYPYAANQMVKIGSNYYYASYNNNLTSVIKMGEDGVIDTDFSIAIGDYPYGNALVLSDGDLVVVKYYYTISKYDSSGKNLTPTELNYTGGTAHYIHNKKFSDLIENEIITKASIPNINDVVAFDSLASVINYGIKFTDTTNNFRSQVSQDGLVINEFRNYPFNNKTSNIGNNFINWTDGNYVTGDKSLNLLPTFASSGTNTIYFPDASGTVFLKPNGLTTQYLRGDGSLSVFQTDVRGSLLTGLSTATSTAIVATDSVLAAFGKAQGQLNLKANLTSPAFSGTPTAPTASAGTNTTQIATTAFVRQAVSAATSGSTAAWGNITGTLSAQTDLQTALNAKQNTISGTGFAYWTGGTGITWVTGTSATYVTGNGGVSNFISGVRSADIGTSITGTSQLLSTTTFNNAVWLLQNQVNTKFATPTGTTAQYLRGDGSLASFQSAALATTITGLTFTNSAVNNGDTIVGAIGKLQQQHDFLSGQAILIDGASPVDVERAWYGTKAQFDALAVIDPATEYNISNSENYGSTTVNPSLSNTINIAHGIGVVPNYVNVQFSDTRSSEISQYKISANTTNIVIEFANMPTETSLTLWWMVKV